MNFTTGKKRAGNGTKSNSAVYKTKECRIFRKRKSDLHNWPAKTEVFYILKNFTLLRSVAAICDTFSVFDETSCELAALL